MDILAGRLTRAMRADMADNEARLVSLAGERFSQSAIEEVGTYDIDNLRARDAVSVGPGLPDTPIGGGAVAYTTRSNDDDN